MRIIRGLPSVPPERRPSAVALGVFDGVHLGHRAILGAAVAHARATGSPALACTFEPHPLEVLQPDRAPLPITTLDERLALIGACGDADMLRDLGRGLGFSVDVIEPLMVDGAPVSSTAIRAALGRGDLDAAARM